MKGLPNIYARQTSLHDVRGRLDYISNPERQEHLLAFHDGAAELAGGAYWKILALECQGEFKKFGREGKSAVEGRELMIQLPNSLLDRMTAPEICQALFAELTEKLDRPVAVALHYNKTQSNLHAHAIYSERELLREPVEKVAERNLFFDEQGKRHYKKAEILDDAGQLQPGCRIVQKGEAYERHAFGLVDHMYSEKQWLKDFKTNTILPLINGPLRGDATFSEYDPATGKLPQQHVGKNLQPEQQETVQNYNKAVKEYNGMVDDGRISPEKAMEIQKMIQHTQEGKLERLRRAISQINIQEFIRQKGAEYSAQEEPSIAPEAQEPQRADPPKEENPPRDLLREILEKKAAKEAQEAREAPKKDGDVFLDIRNEKPQNGPQSAKESRPSVLERIKGFFFGSEIEQTSAAQATPQTAKPTQPAEPVQQREYTHPPVTMRTPSAPQQPVQPRRSVREQLQEIQREQERQAAMEQSLARSSTDQGQEQETDELEEDWDLEL